MACKDAPIKEEATINDTNHTSKQVVIATYTKLGNFRVCFNIT